MKKICFILMAFVFMAKSFGQSTENYLLHDIGYVSIPTSMEIQSGNYKKLAQEYQRQQGKKFGYEVLDDHIVFQQKGLNNGEKSAFSSYARVIIETIMGNHGDFEKLTTKLSATQSELNQLSSQSKTEIEQAFQGTGLKLITWYGAQIVNINGRTAIKISYLRQLDDHPYVAVSIYMFHNEDRMHKLTLSYRQADANTWKPLYEGILKSFTITNIR